LPANQVRHAADVTPLEEPDAADTSSGNVLEPLHDVAIGLSAPGVFSAGPEDFELTQEPAIELPEPETVDVDVAAAADEPLDTSAFTFMQLAIPLGPVNTADTAENVRAEVKHDATRPAASAPDDASDTDDLNDPLSAGAMELVRSRSSVLRSPAFAPDAQSQLQYRRDVAQAIRRKQQEERDAALLEPPPPPRAPTDVVPTSLPAPPDAGGSTSVEQVEALRGAAQQLDEIANHLERQNLYPRADQVRAVAQEMRVDARKGPQPSSGTSLPSTLSPAATLPSEHSPR
jgi:hypothetical protein